MVHKLPTPQKGALSRNSNYSYDYEIGRFGELTQGTRAIIYVACAPL